MLLRVPCPQCTVGKRPGDPGSLNFTDGEMDNSGVVYLTCSQQHSSAVIFDARRYQILLRSGAKAFVKGFSNEAIASFSAALERAHEFYAKVICRSRGVTPEILKKAWGSVAKKSERQFGAFTFLFLLDQGQVLELDPKIPSIRNSVIHAGNIATQKEALDFGEMVFRRIRQIEVALESHEQAVGEEGERELKEQEQSVTPGVGYARIKIQTVRVQGNLGVGVAETLSEYLDALRVSIEKGMA